MFLAKLFGKIGIAAETLVCVEGVERGRTHESEWTEFDVETDGKVAAGFDGIMKGLVGYVAKSANLGEDEKGREEEGERRQT